MEEMGEISSFLYHANERTDPARPPAPRPQMEIPDLYANSIFVAARGVGRRDAAQRAALRPSLRRKKPREGPEGREAGKARSPVRARDEI